MREKGRRERGEGGRERRIGRHSCARERGEIGAEREKEKGEKEVETSRRGGGS